MMQWNKPKSVRQIGDAPGRERIYMEDYVVRFAKKLARHSRGEEKAAVLLGGVYNLGHEKIYQISGIIEISGFSEREDPRFSQNMWDRIYTDIKENFTDLEIIGWFYSWKGFKSKEASALLEIHKQNFQHRDKVLYLFEQEEEEDCFFLYRNGEFVRQKGHYIYYEKNPEMLAFMERENNRHIHIIEQEDDRVVRNIRGVMEEKEKTRQVMQQRQQRESRFGYSLGALVALILIVLGVSALKNQQTLGEMKSQVALLQDMALGNESVRQVTTVETMGGGVVKMTATPAAVEGQAVGASGAAVSGAAVEGTPGQ